MIKYVTRFNGIEKVEVSGETEHFVELQNGTREAKQNDWSCYFDSFDEAKKHLLDRAQDRVCLLQRQLDLAEIHLDKVKGMQARE